MNRCAKIFCIVFLIASGSEVCSQAVTWQRVYGGPQPEYGKDGIQTLDGGYAILGLRQGNNGGTLLLQLDSLGNTIWMKIIDSVAVGSCIRQSSDSGFFIAGSGNGRGILIKTNKLGSVLWKKSYTINNQISSFRKVKILSNGELLLGGIILSLPSQGYILRTDSIGNVFWQRAFYNINYSASIYDVTESLDSHIYITGLSLVNNFPKTLLGKLTPDGTLLWTKSYGAEGKGDAQSSISIVSDSESDFFLTGAYSDFYSSEAHFTKIDSSGNVIFQNVLPQTNFANRMCLSSSGNFAIAGGVATTSDDILFLLLNRNGNVISKKIFNSSGIEGDFSESVVQAEDKGFLITGNTSFLSTSDQDDNIYVIKTDSIGNATPLKIQNVDDIIATSFELYQNYPNPFNPTTKINYTLSENSFVAIKVFDILGKEAVTLVNQKQNAGSYSVEFNGSNLSSGVYYYQLETGNNFEIKKMILIK